MKIYFTRHGQVATDAEYYGDVNYPRGDLPLSAVGREQARLLGERLKKEGFSGKIFSSPFMRTMETAEIIAELTGSVIYPTAGFHEIFRAEDTVNEFRGADIDTLKKRFPSVARDADLPLRWWTKTIEKYEDVRYRVAVAIDNIIDSREEEVLLVGHGASVMAMTQFLSCVADPTPFCNCSFNLFNLKGRALVKNCTRHLPYDMITYNARRFKDTAHQIEIPDALSSEQGKRILHIGDTQTSLYPWYFSLIKALKPDVIIHTGDTADELKVSRDLEACPVYLDRVKHLFEAFLESGAEVYWIRGNNDLENEVKALAPFVKIVEPGSILELEGKKIGVAHAKNHLPDGCDFYMYGHSTRYEIWSNERNTPESDEWYLNAMWSANLLLLPERKLYNIEIPKL